MTTPLDLTEKSSSSLSSLCQQCRYPEWNCSGTTVSGHIFHFCNYSCLIKFFQWYSSQGGEPPSMPLIGKDYVVDQYNQIAPSNPPTICLTKSSTELGSMLLNKLSTSPTEIKVDIDYKKYVYIKCKDITNAAGEAEDLISFCFFTTGRNVQRVKVISGHALLEMDNCQDARTIMINNGLKYSDFIMTVTTPINIAQYKQFDMKDWIGHENLQLQTTKEGVVIPALPGGVKHCEL